jgi:GlpG protein
MRQIGTIPDRSQANRFAAYLLTQGIHAHCEEKDDHWSIWVREEDQLQPAKAAFSEFLADPNHARYQASEKEAQLRARDENAKREAAKQNVVEMRNRWGNRRPARRRPMTIAIVLLCCGLFIVSDSSTGTNPANNTVHRTLMFRDPIQPAADGERETFTDKLRNIRQHQWWRIFTPAFLHANVLHLAMNMVMFYQLAGAIEHRRSTWRLGLLILSIGVISNLFQALVPNEIGGTSQFLGLSGVVYGLFSYLWMKSRFEPALGLYIDRGTVVILVAYLLLGFAGVLNSGDMRIANWAHGAGFVSGIVIGIFPVLLRRFSKPTEGS